MHRTPEKVIELTFPIGALLNLLVILSLFILQWRTYRRIVSLERKLTRWHSERTEIHVGPMDPDGEFIRALRARHDQELDEIPHHDGG